MYARYGFRSYVESTRGGGNASHPGRGGDVHPATGDAGGWYDADPLGDADGDVKTASLSSAGVDGTEGGDRGVADALAAALGSGGGSDGDGDGVDKTAAESVSASDADAVAASASDADVAAATGASGGDGDGGGGGNTGAASPVCGADAMKGARVSAFYSGAALQSCVSGTCVDGRCVCSVLYTGDTCSRPVRIMNRRGTALERWKLPYRGQLTLAKDNVGVGTRYRSVIELDIAGELPRFIGPVGPPLLRNLPDTDAMRGGGVFFDRCAIVGSSGALLASERGAEIDAHDLVMRFNNAPTHGFEAYVGRKTTHRVSNSLNFNFRESDEEAVLQIMRSPQAFKQFIAAFNRADESAKRAGAFHARHKGPRIKLYAFHVDFARYLADSFHFQTSVGFQGIVTALMSCREVDVYGFAAGPSEGYAHHYWSSTDKSTFSPGRDLKEWQALRAMAQLGLIRLKDACLEECHAGRARCTACANKLEQERLGIHEVERRDPALSEDAYLASVARQGMEMNEGDFFEEDGVGVGEGVEI